MQTLIAPTGTQLGDPALWSSQTLGTTLFSRRNDIVFLGGHFTQGYAIAADGATALDDGAVLTAQPDLTNTLVESIGCHSGYNLVDADGVPDFTWMFDWAQAFARRGATLVAGTGYQYGSPDSLNFSELLYLDFNKELRTGTYGTARRRRRGAGQSQAELPGPRRRFRRHR